MQMARRILDEVSERYGEDAMICTMEAIVQTSELAAKRIATLTGDGLGNSSSWAGWNNCKSVGSTALRTFSHIPPIAAEKDDG
jgi:hypothetical protein